MSPIDLEPIIYYDVMFALSKCSTPKCALKTIYPILSDIDTSTDWGVTIPLVFFKKQMIDLLLNNAPYIESNF